MAPFASATLQSLTSLADRSLHDVSLISTRTIKSSIRQLLPRQNSDPSIIPTTYGSINSGPAPGTVVGIVLGSVGGFLLILWLIYTCLTMGGWGGPNSIEEEVVIHDRRKSRHGSTRSRRVSETVEVRRGPSPVRIVREPVPIPMPPPPPRQSVRETVIVEEHRSRERPRLVSVSSTGSSDEVVVIEEHSPPRRKKSAREREEREGRESGYRTVDPLAYGGAVGGRRSSGGRRER